MMIDKSYSSIFSTSKSIITLENALDMTGLSESAFRKQTELINARLKAQSRMEITIVNDEVHLPKDLLEVWLHIYFELPHDEPMVYSIKARQMMLYILIFAGINNLSVFHLQDFFNVSRNTILNDLKSLRTEISQHHLKINHSRNHGFYLVGSEYEIRILALKKLNILRETLEGNYLMAKGLFDYGPAFQAQVEADFQQSLEISGLKIVPNRFEEAIDYVAYLIGRLTNQASSFQFTKQEKSLLQSLPAYQSSEYLIACYPEINNAEIEKLYMTTLYMSILYDTELNDELNFLERISQQIVAEVEKLSAIGFNHRQDLINELYQHLVPTYFRINYGIPLTNVLLEQIISQYGDLFQIVKLSLEPLQQHLHHEIPDDEVGYITMLFGGKILSNDHVNKAIDLQALIVCPNGISSALIMKSELEKLFPQITFSKARIGEYDLNDDQIKHYDLIFSSVPLDLPIKTYLIRPLMSQIEKNALMTKVQKDFLLPGSLMPSIREIIDLIIPYIELKKGVSKSQLITLVTQQLNSELIKKEDSRPMLKELLTDETIRFTEETLNWQEAIKLSSQPLLEEDKITDNYVEEMINRVEEFGPFIHIGEGIALPHARPEDGVNELGMTLLKVSEPVLLADQAEHPIDIFITLAAVDNETHLKALATLTQILTNKEKLQQLKQAENVADVQRVIYQEED